MSFQVDDYGSTRYEERLREAERRRKVDTALEAPRAQQKANGKSGLFASLRRRLSNLGITLSQDRLQPYEKR